jgi:cytochrome c biogenesis factor
LKSYWLVFHITAMFISYSGFALAAVFSLMYLLRAKGVKLLANAGERMSLRYLDETANRIIMIAVPVLTLGVALGAFWADAAWGRYWGWDPKETWALATWLIYIAYLHFRHRPGWLGYRSAVLSCLGFMAVLITFQGVNLLDNVFSLNSIHAYTMGAANVQKDIISLGILALPTLVFLVMLFLRPPAGDLSETRSSEPEEQLGTPIREAMAQLRGDSPAPAPEQPSPGVGQ